MSTTAAAAPIATADRLAADGDLNGAATLLEQVLDDQSSPEQWLKLAGLRRALKQPRRALEAVHRALALAPLDFVALVMRAGLLERLGDSAAGEAWGEALAQQPDGPLPGPLAAAVAQGRQAYSSWLAEREDRIAVQLTATVSDADAEELKRIDRFASNALRRTRVFHSSPTHFHFPGLAEREFHPRGAFPWLEHLEAASEVIRAELRALLASERAELVPYLDYQDHEALAQWRPLNHNPDWTAVHLLRQGERVAQNADKCPQTMAVLGALPQPGIPGASPNAMFSLLAPHTAIPPHVGVNNARLVCHLALEIPPGCWFRVGTETRPWQEGEAFVFDDTIEHEAANPSDSLRAVLIADVWHPGLSATERRGVASVVAAMGSRAAI